MGDRQLAQIEHIVVLMLENRSFDQILGYLSLAGRRNVDGLTGNESNTFNGNTYRIAHRPAGRFPHDPCHESQCVAQQISAGTMQGFVQNFAAVRAVTAKDLADFMHYHDAADVRIYEHLARHFTVCDRWFASVPGPTHPNRAYAISGSSNALKRNLNPLFHLFPQRTVFEQLPPSVSWRYYSHDIAFLRMFSRFVDDPGVHINKIGEFYKACEQGTLPHVCWIDPHFGYLLGQQNDDHPPASVTFGQQLVGRVYESLLLGANDLWSRTLFVVVYDEHGGFYDHVDCTATLPADDLPDFRHYGVRVPAIVASPWVAAGACHGSPTSAPPFDHTSLIKTITKRFAPREPALTARIAHARDLGEVLTEESPRTDRPRVPMLRRIQLYGVRGVVGTKSALAPPQVTQAPSELQESMRALAQRAEREGVPPNKL